VTSFWITHIPMPLYVLHFFTLFRVCCRDFDSFDLRKRLPAVISKLYKAINSNGGVTYIHCTAGLGRAPAVAVCLLVSFLIYMLLADNHNYLSWYVFELILGILKEIISHLICCTKNGLMLNVFGDLSWWMVSAICHLNVLIWKIHSCIVFIAETFHFHHLIEFSKRA